MEGPFTGAHHCTVLGVKLVEDQDSGNTGATSVFDMIYYT